MLNLLAIKKMISSKLIRFGRINKGSVAAVILIFFFLLSRLINLSKLPLFADEAFAILRAREVNFNENLLGMIRLNTQPVFIWTVAIFQRIPLSLVISARFVSVITGLITALLLGYAGEKFVGRGTFLKAFIAVTFLPFSLFYDRTALFESMVLMFMSLSMFIPMVGVPLAILTKQTGWLILPLIAGIYRNEKLKLIGITLVVVLTVFSLWWLAIDEINHFATTVFRQAQHLSLWVNFKNNLLRTKIWLEAYLTISIIILMLTGFIEETLEVMRIKKFTLLMLFGVWMCFVVFFEALTARVFYPRYLYPVVIPVVLLVVKGWVFLERKINQTILNAVFNCAFKIILSSVLFVPALLTDWKIITNPSLAPIASEDHFQFYEDFTSGVGAGEIVDEVLEIFYQKGLPLSVYLEDDSAFLVALLDKKELKEARVEIADWLKDPLTVIPDKILTENGESLFVRNRHPDIPADWPVELAAEIPKTQSRSVYLYRIIK